MKTGLKAAMASVCMVGLMVQGQALAVTKKGMGYHCVNNRGVEVKAATRAGECKLPYHWVKNSTTAAAKAKAKSLANAKKRRGHVAARETRDDNRQ